MTPEEREAHWTKKRQEFEENDRADCEIWAHMSTMNKTDVGPLPPQPLPRPWIQKPRLDYIASRIDWGGLNAAIQREEDS